MNWNDVPDLFESSPPYQEAPKMNETNALPAVVLPSTAAAPSNAKATLDKVRGIVDSLEPDVAAFASLVPVAGADLKLGLAALKGALDAADSSVDQGASAGAVILAALKGALAGL